MVIRLELPFSPIHLLLLKRVFFLPLSIHVKTQLILNAQIVHIAQLYWPYFSQIVMEKYKPFS